MMFQYLFNETTVKDFYYDDEDLLLPADTQMTHDGKVWALYINEPLDVSFIITRGVLNGLQGWRVMVIPGIINLSYAGFYVKQKCGECLGLR